uniref:Uncharacterized protein LOC104250166 n=1 Tax=Nicotiana sylvestris TaxID=4096 RepID=A0A1U7YSY3_NICSY|nr:PREDICTED: uncharacterized protein LOC104250166 [Nicotiana sylvestris]
MRLTPRKDPNAAPPTLEKRKPKKEKNRVLKADNHDSSEEDSDMAYLTKRFQKMVRKNGEMLKRGSSNKSKNNNLCYKYGKAGHFMKNCPLLKQEFSKNFKRKRSADNVVKRAFASGKSKDETDTGDSSMMAIMGGSGLQWIMDSRCSKHMNGNTMDYLLLKALQVDNDSKTWHKGLGGYKFLTYGILMKNDMVHGTRWVFKNELDEHGNATKNKARLVVQGFNQEEGIDHDETFGLIACMEAIKIHIAFGSHMEFTLFQMDVKSAFLNGLLKEEVYIKLLPGF